MSTNGQGLNLRSFTGFNREQAADPIKDEAAEFWLNIGYETKVNNDGVEETIFVSLARGIPLDSIKPFDVSKTRSDNMAGLRDAQNKLQESFMAEARTLAPGEQKLLIVDEAIGLAVQVKRVRAAQTAPTENALVRPVSFQRPAPAESNVKSNKQAA
jgi:hypothetical protein